ncbi:MAG: DUF420 domain-containing protein [Deltaproteobacteria bacterium]|nr:MAG: DUF420 domain-containing protein [Deltaproteobacteria bacterium]
MIFNALISSVALAFLTWLLLFRQGEEGTIDLSFMPGVNAGWNSLSTVLLVAGGIAIKGGRRDLHRHLMVGAFASSVLFLIGYVAYHYAHGDTRYEGDYRALYLPILATHVLLSMTVVPMALSAFYFAIKKRFGAHKRVTRILLPVWLYVSVTGVVIWYMLHT